MAYSKTPQTSTYQTKQVPLLNEWETRDATSTKDNDAINCFYELIQNKKTGDKDYFVVKRDGTSAYPYTAPTSELRGLHYWEDQNKLFLALSTNIYVINASTGVLITTLSTFSSATTLVGFCEFLFDTDNVKLCATDGTTLVTIDSSNTVVTVTAPDLPVPHLPYPTFMDGYLFLVKSGTADIYNSNLNDPELWTAGDFITAEMAADKIVLLSNLNNYLIVFGSGSIEYFWDAANPTGSPLQRYDTPIKYTGYVSGFAKFANKILFIGNSNNTGNQVYLIEDLKLEPIGTPPIRRALEPDVNTPAVVVTYGGHDFYHITIEGLSYEYDLDTKLWTRSTFKQLDNFPIKFAQVIFITGIGSVTLFINDGDEFLYYFYSGVYQDNSVAFTTTVITDNQSFETYNRKTCSRMSIHADRPETDGNLEISWTDDDYQTFNTPRSVNLNQSFPDLTRLGQFRRRAFKLEWTEDLPLRLKQLELDLNMDQS